MVPFKPYFLGQETPPYDRARSACRSACAPRTSRTSARPPGTARSSRCAATSPSATTSRKARSSSPGTWSPSPRPTAAAGFEESRLWPSVYDDDPEAVALWTKVTGLPDEPDRAAGQEGELLVDGRARPRAARARRSSTTAARSTARTRLRDTRAGMPPSSRTATSRSGTSSSCRTSSARSAAKDDFDIAGSLPKKNIDTGMGLERVAFLLQGKDNMYEIDVMFPVIEKAAGALRPRRYGADHEDDVRFRVVADHVRSAMMLIGDGVTPGNEAPRLRAAPAAAPRRPLHAAARRRGPRAARAVAGQPRQDGRDLHRAGSATGSASRRSRTPRRTRSGRRCAPARTIFDLAAQEAKPAGGDAAVRRARRSRCTTPTASRST